MITFEVKDMTCGHCVSTITKALQSVDSHAKFTIDLARHLVMIESSDIDPKNLQDVIVDAGYTPMPVEGGTDKSSAQAKTCCGSKQ